ncbi:MAG TPA: class I SAM-dependent methyltransferase [Povalibacter sp.]|nr:class I SAM-dependent methyltransferase [Povalibacter sp.]
MSGGCRFCRAPLTRTVLDLGLSPISNQFRSADRVLNDGQTFYPLTVMVCERCWLVQLTNVETPPHFTDEYVYFSSHSTSWLEHARRYAQSMIQRLALDSQSLVVEIASNDGYLLKNFRQAGIRVLGVEPTANTAEHARAQHGIESIVDFFGARLGNELARKGYRADLICGNNVLAHVPDINDFVAGIPPLLKPGGTVTFEFPHVLRMLSDCQFDTIYHEHFSYLSLVAVEQVFGAHGLEVYGVEQLGTHGGSLRVYAAHAGSDLRDAALAAGRDQVRHQERAAGLNCVDTYARFGDEVIRRKLDLLEFLIAAKRDGKKVIGYGAPAKGNTLLNYCGIGPELVAYTVDRSPAKQGKYLPGVNLPVRTPEDLVADRPDFILILPWNLREEIAGQLAAAREWGAKFVVAIPEVQVF